MTNNLIAGGGNEVPSSRAILARIRKFETSLVSFFCNSTNCIKFTTEGVHNEIDFMKENGSGYSCSPVGINRDSHNILSRIAQLYP